MILNAEFHKMIELTKEQKKHQQSIRWLLGEGPRCCGKTFLMAYTFLEMANRERERPIHVFDHHFHLESKKYLLDQIQIIFNNHYDTEKFDLVIRKSDHTIVIKRKPEEK